jgi:iron-sulfur cluster repair protein YtfE (RIC family)
MSLPLLEPDPVASLVHDHGNINRLLLELGQEMESLRRLEPVDFAPAPEIEDALHALRDLLFLHFAQEEEGLFPFVSEALPALAGQVQAMAEAHDGICGGLSRMIHMLETKADPMTMVGVFDRFEHAYAEHARQETQLLEAVDRDATPAQLAALAELVRGL